jgi:hypothetical protein
MARMQRTACCGAIKSSGGNPARQAALACAQRGAKLQLGKAEAGSGGWPGMSGRCAPGGLSPTDDAISPTV